MHSRTSVHVLFLFVCVCVSNYLNQRLDAITVFHVLDRTASGEKDKNWHRACVFQARAPGQITCDQPGRRDSSYKIQTCTCRHWYRHSRMHAHKLLSLSLMQLEHFSVSKIIQTRTRGINSPALRWDSLKYNFMCTKCVHKKMCLKAQTNKKAGPNDFL